MSNVIISRSGGSSSTVSLDNIEGVLPIDKGGTGNTTGLAASATILATSRTIRTNLASTSTASFNGSAAVTPGVTGTLGVANGGTGKTTHTSGEFLRGAGTSAITSVSATNARAQMGFGYGTCTTGSSAGVKILIVANFALITGARVTVKFAYAISYVPAELNINNTGDKFMCLAGSIDFGSKLIGSGDIVDFIYDGTYWQILSINSAID